MDNTNPAHRFRQVYTLVDFLLPDAVPDAAQSNSRWVLSGIPLVLSDLSDFFRALDVDRRLDLLFPLDNGTLNVGEWLLAEEFSHMHTVNIASLLVGVRGSHHLLA